MASAASLVAAGEGGVRWRTAARQTARARQLRRQRTEAEEALWQRVRAGRLGGFKFRTQVPIGPYHPDFCCPSAKLVVELDGGQHGEPEQVTHDAERTAFLQANGYRVVRFWNSDVLANMDGALTAILSALHRDHSLPNPSPLQGEGL